MKSTLLKLLFFLVIFSCQQPNQQKTETKEQIKSEDGIEYLSLVENLRLRKHPELKSEVIYSFKEGEEMVFSGNKSEHKDRITIRKKKINEHWFEVKVKSNQNIEGWVFGGAIGMKGEKSNLPKLRKKEEIEGLSIAEVESIIGVKGVKSFQPYRGYYHYYLTSNEAKIKDGKFRFFGGDGEDMDALYTGEFTNGIKTDVFEETYSYSGEINLYGSHTSKLYFDDEGHCTKIHFEGNNEKGKYNKIFVEPECNFTDYHVQFRNENTNIVTTSTVNIKPSTAVEDARRKAAESMARRIKKEDLVGNWTIIMKATSSDCSVVNVGDIRTESWLMSIVSRKLIATKAAGSEKTANEYVETTYTSSNSLKMSNTRKKNNDPKVKIDMEVVNSRYMKGTRIVSNVQPCTIIYNITAEKK